MLNFFVRPKKRAACFQLDRRQNELCHFLPSCSAFDTPACSTFFNNAWSTIIYDYVCFFPVFFWQLKNWSRTFCAGWELMSCNYVTLPCWAEANMESPSSVPQWQTWKRVTLQPQVARVGWGQSNKDSHAFNANSLPTYMALYSSISSETAIIGRQSRVPRAQSIATVFVSQQRAWTGLHNTRVSAALTTRIRA